MSVKELCFELSIHCICSSIHLDRYCSAISHKTDMECSQAPTDDLIRFWMLKVKVTAGDRGKDIHVDAEDESPFSSLDHAG